MKKRKALLLAGGCAALALLLVGGWLLWLFLQPKFQETLSIPKEAKVILRFSTRTASVRPAYMRSELYFYGEDGTVLDAYREEEECVDRFMIGGKHATWFFFQCHTIHVDNIQHAFYLRAGDRIYCLEAFVPTSDSPTYDLFLTTFDIASGKVLDTKTILEDAPRVEEMDSRVFRTQNGEQISQQQIPFVFSDASSINYTDLEEPAATFRDVAIQVNNDGDVFVIAQYKDSTIKIFRLEDGGAYTQVWEGKRPKGLGNDMYLTSFMLIDEP